VLSTVTVVALATVGAMTKQRAMANFFIFVFPIISSVTIRDFQRIDIDVNNLSGPNISSLVKAALDVLRRASRYPPARDMAL
jgi:hypothetical protein